MIMLTVELCFTCPILSYINFNFIFEFVLGFGIKLIIVATPYVKNQSFLRFHDFLNLFEEICENKLEAWSEVIQNCVHQSRPQKKKNMYRSFLFFIREHVCNLSHFWHYKKNLTSEAYLKMCKQGTYVFFVSCFDEFNIESLVRKVHWLVK